MCMCVTMCRCIATAGMFEVREKLCRVGCSLLPLLDDLVFYCCQKITQKTWGEMALFWLTVSEGIQSFRPGHKASPYTAVSSPEAERKQEMGAGYKTLEFTPSAKNKATPLKGQWPPSTSPPARDQVFKDMSLRRTFPIRTTTRRFSDWTQITSLVQQAPLPPEPAHCPLLALLTVSLKEVDSLQEK